VAGVLLLAAVTLLLPACFRGGSELSESGKGLPVVGVRFPPETEPGSVHTSRLSVRNPGPGDISSLAVAFALVGAPASQGLPNPLVDPGRGPDSGTVVAVSPEPTARAPDVLYRFGPLPEGEAITISFELEVPVETGPAASSVTVYDDVDPGRARGVRLETTVER
jgi:hypothetical protein